MPANLSNIMGGWSLLLFLPTRQRFICVKIFGILCNIHMLCAACGSVEEALKQYLDQRTSAGKKIKWVPVFFFFLNRLSLSKLNFVLFRKLFKHFWGGLSCAGGEFELMTISNILIRAQLPASKLQLVCMSLMLSTNVLYLNWLTLKDLFSYD